MKMLYRLAFVLPVVACLVSCTPNLLFRTWPNFDASIVLDGAGQIDPYVENGTAYDRATFDIGQFKNVVHPDNATIRRSNAPAI